MDDAITSCRSCDREIDVALTWCPFCGSEQQPAPSSRPAGEAEEPSPAPARGVPAWLRTRTAGMALAALLIIGLGAIWFFFVRDDDRGAISLLDIGPGDCWVDPATDPGADSIGSVPEVPCSEPHTFEVFAVYELAAGPDGAYPATEIAATADVGCRTRLGGYTGVPYADSPLDVWPLYPTEDSWFEGDREVVCSLFSIDGTDSSSSQRDAGERLAVPTIDAAGAADCPALAEATVPIAQAFVDFVDAQSAAENPGELPPALLSAYKSELLLTARADELGCTIAELNSRFATLADALTARTDAGRALIDDYAANGYFASG